MSFFVFCVIKIACSPAANILVFLFSVPVLEKLGPCTAHATAVLDFKASVQKTDSCKCRKCSRMSSLGACLSPTSVKGGSQMTGSRRQGGFNSVKSTFVGFR